MSADIGLADVSPRACSRNVVNVINLEGEGDDQVGEDTDLPEDMYGAALFSFIVDWFDIATRTENRGLALVLNIYRVCLVAAILLLTYGFQCGLLYWITIYNLEPTVHRVQNIYRRYHAELFSEAGNLSLDDWERWSHHDKHQLCSIGFASYLFMYVILCLWCFNMVIDIRATDRLLRHVRSLEQTSSPHGMVSYEFDEDGAPITRIKSLTRGVRWFLYMMVILPKLAIGSGLLVVGLIWLSANDSFADLILNVVALQFVVDNDAVLYEAILPKTVASSVASTKFWKKTSTAGQDDQAKTRAVLTGYARSIGYSFGIMVFVWLFMTIGQEIPYLGTFPGFAHDANCTAFRKEISSRVCEAGKNCFPYAERVS